MNLLAPSLSGSRITENAIALTQDTTVSEQVKIMLTQIAKGRVYDYSHSVGRGAASGMGFSQPAAMALEGNTVYVLNRGIEGISNVPWNRLGYGARVSIIDLGDEAGDEAFTGEFGKYGDRDGEFIWPSGMVLGPNGHIFVSDEWLNQVSVFDKDGTFLRRWSTVPVADGKEHSTANIAGDADGNIYCTDGRSHEVRKFTADGQLIAGWGSLGDGDGEFDSPWGITVDRNDGSVYVADHRNHRVQKFTADGAWLMQIGEPGSKRGQLHLPVKVTVDPQGDVYVADWSDNGMHAGRVHVFDREGGFIISLIGDAQQLSKWADMTVVANADYMKRRREVATTESEWRFALPTDVHFDDRRGRLVVLDAQRSRLQIYHKMANYMVPQMNL